MKIYFVRHGHPNYKDDCLTELGHKQASAAAERLKDCGISQIFASTMGRAQQTAKHTADLLGLDVIGCDFIREISWGSLDGEPLPERGHPWHVSTLRAAEGKSIFMKDWQEHYPYNNSKVVDSFKSVSEGVDAWLLELGYKREGDYYRVVGEDTDKTVAMFSHAGASSAALSHMLNIPLPQFCGAFPIDFTSVTIIDLSNEVGALVYPDVLLLNDARHIEGITVENFIGN